MTLLRATILAASLLFLMGSAEAQRPFEQISGPESIEQALSSSGTYAVFFDPRSRDTVRVWLEHVTPHRFPSYGKAQKADVVVWCYPQRYPYPTHVMPDAKGQLVIRRDGDQILISEKQTSRQ